MISPDKLLQRKLTQSDKIMSNFKTASVIISEEFLNAQIEKGELEVFSEEDMDNFGRALRKACDEASDPTELLEKAKKDTSNLVKVKKQVTREGKTFTQTVYVKRGEEGTTKYKKHGEHVEHPEGIVIGDTVKFTSKKYGKEFTGEVRSLKKNVHAPKGYASIKVEIDGKRKIFDVSFNKFHKEDSSSSEASLPAVGTTVRVKTEGTMTTQMRELAGKDLKVTAHVDSGLISQPKFLVVSVGWHPSSTSGKEGQSGVKMVRGDIEISPDQVTIKGREDSSSSEGKNNKHMSSQQLSSVKKQKIDSENDLKLLEKQLDKLSSEPEHDMVEASEIQRDIDTEKRIINHYEKLIKESEGGEKTVAPDAKAKKFLEAISIAKSGIQLKDIKVEKTNKGNWAVYHQGEFMMVTHGEDLDAGTIKKYDLKKAYDGSKLQKAYRELDLFLLDEDDLVKARPELTGGRWVTLDNGEHVYIKGGKVVAGADDVLSEGKKGKESSKKEGEGKESKGGPLSGKIEAAEKEKEKFLDLARTSKSDIQLKDLTVEATPKGNWQIYHKGKSLSTIGGDQLSEDTIRQYGLEHHHSDDESDSSALKSSKKESSKESTKKPEKVNKSDLAYQLAMDYSGNTKPKILKLNGKELHVKYGYRVDPNDVIDSFNELYPDKELKHSSWEQHYTGGEHRFTIKESSKEGKEESSKEYKPSSEAIDHVAKIVTFKVHPKSTAERFQKQITEGGPYSSPKELMNKVMSMPFGSDPKFKGQIKFAKEAIDSYEKMHHEKEGSPKKEKKKVRSILRD